MLTDRKSLIDAIYKRKSVRKYDMTPLDEGTLNAVREFLANIKPLYDDIKTVLYIQEGSTVRGIFGLEKTTIAAPHYIVAKSEAKGNYIENIGYMLQFVDLFLSANGLGSCWLGMTKPKKDNSDGLEFVITLCFGKPIGSPYRERDAFRRKDVNSFSKVESFTLLPDTNAFLESVRLAPSAMNSQPWYVELNDNGIDIYRVKTGMFKQLITLDKMNQVDIGIFTAICELAAEEQGVSLKVADEDKKLKGYHYLCTMR